MDLGLRDKVTIVAASSEGLGRAVAEEFAREGARVVMCSRDEAAIRAAAEGVQRKTSADVQWTVADVGTAEGCQKLVKTAVDKFGTIELSTVNCQLSIKQTTFVPTTNSYFMERLTIKSWAEEDRPREKLMLKGKHALSDAELLAAVANGGIPCGLDGFVGVEPSKSNQQASQYQAKTLSSDLAKDGVRVNCVQPGRIFTERIEQLDSDTAKRQNTTPDAIRAHYEKTVIPMGRYGKPEEFAAAVVFLASPKASYITGTSLQVDGGMLMSMF